MRPIGTGGNVVAPPQWDDERFPFTGQRIDVSGGRLDYNYSELGVDFQSNALYPNDVVGMICQMHHAWKQGDNICPHLHWAQNQNAVPNWLLEYRLYDNGEAIPAAWTQLTGTELFTYTAGTILQITDFGEIDASSLTGVSAFIDFKLYRDSNNASGQFAGADPYAGDALSKEYDIHYRRDSSGSKEEFAK